MPAVEDQSSRYHGLSRVAFWLAAALLTARGMTQLYLRDVLPVLPLGPGEIAPAAAPGPATQIMLDALSFASALLVLLRWAIDSTFHLARAGSVFVLLALVLWTFASTFWADDAFAAGVSASAWLACAALAFALANTCRAWRDLRLVGALAAGLLLINVVAGIYFVYVDHPSTLEALEQNEVQLLVDRGFEPGSTRAELFLGRIRRGEFAGFNASPNSYGGTLVLLSFALVGAAVARLRLNREAAWGVVLLVALPPAAYLLWRTQSRTAIAAGALSGVGLLLFWVGRKLIAKRRNLAISTLVIAALLGGGLLVALGVAESLPHVSLRFRWNYWLGGLGVLSERPLTGVGFANFGDFYVAHRPLAAAEEVKDPHNLIVRFFSETGIVGGLLALLWLGWLAIDLSRPARPQASGGSPTLLKPAILLGVIAVVLSAVATIDFGSDPAFIAISLMKFGAYAIALVTAVILAHAYDRSATQVCDEPAPFLLAALLAGAAAVVLHAMLDVVLFESSILAAFVLIVAPIVGLARLPVREDRRRVPRVARFGVAGFAAVATVIWLVAFAVPVVLAEHKAAEGDDLVRDGKVDAASLAFSQAADRSPVSNADYLQRAARAAAMAGDDAAVVEFANRSAAARPRSTAAPLLLAQVARQSGDVAAEVDALRRAVQLNPNEMSLRLELADALQISGDAVGAAEQLRAMLRVQDALADDEMERLDEAAVAEARARIERLDESP